MTAHVYTDWAGPLSDDIDIAEESILITSLSLQPPRRDGTHPLSMLWTSMDCAVRRGVRIDFVLAQVSRSHPATAFNGSAAAHLHDIGVRPHVARMPKLLHAKTAIIDHSILWVGSGNWTAAATMHNHEAYLRLNSPALAIELAEYFRQAFIANG